MAKLSPDQLSRALKSALAPVYLVSGDEPLLVQECCDEIRQKARAEGFQERQVFHVDAGFQWEHWLESANSLSLFAEKKLMEVRLNHYKLAEAGAAALKHYCQAPADDNVLLLLGPKLDRSAKNSAWLKAVELTGTLVTVWPVGEQQLHRWLEQRIQRAGLKADSAAIDVLAGKVEGNLLAAIQEIEKLKYLTTDGFVDSQLMASTVVDSARYSVFGLVDKALAGNPRSAATTLSGLRSEGTEPAVVLWALSREVRTLLQLKQAVQTGQAFDQAARRNGVFNQRVPLMRDATQRLGLPVLRLSLRLCALTDRTIKGAQAGDPWQSLLDITLLLAGIRALSGASLQRQIAIR